MPLSKAQERIRQRVIHAADNEVGELPPVRNPKRKAACKKSLPKFMLTYCCGVGGFLKTPPSKKMYAIIENLQKVIVSGGRTQIRVARGHGKSSFVKAACVYALAYGYRKFVVAVAARRSDASSMIDDIYSLLEIGEEIGEDFPELCVPIRRLERIAQRCRNQTYNGVPTRIEKTAERIILPTIAKSAASGAILVARGFKGAARGLVKGALRPDLILMDDLQDDKVARNPELVAKYVETIDKTLLGLGGHDQTLSAVMCDTPCAPDDLSEHYAQSTAWLTFTYRMLISEANCWLSKNDLWQKYYSIRKDSIAAGEPEHIAANEFYRGHRAEMDEGAEVLNPDFFDRETELSGIQHAYNLRFANGEDAFQSEYQMHPTRRKDSFAITAPLVASRVNQGKPEFWIPPETVFCAAATDLNISYALTSAIVAFAKDQSGFVPWYGLFRSPPLPIPDDIPDKVKSQLITQALIAQGKQIAELCRTHGITLNRWGIDAGGKGFEPVNNFAKTARQTCGCGCIPMVGRAGRNWNPNVRSKIADPRNDTVLCADPTHGWKWLAFNADTWRETAQRAWLGEVGTPGSLSLYDDGVKHGEFSAQVAGEVLEWKIQLPNGQTEYRWREVGRKHDFGDDVTMCFALAGAWGISASGYVPPVARRKVVSRFKMGKWKK